MISSLRNITNLSLSRFSSSKTGPKEKKTVKQVNSVTFFSAKNLSKCHKIDFFVFYVFGLVFSPMAVLSMKVIISQTTSYIEQSYTSIPLEKLNLPHTLRVKRKLINSKLDSPK